MKPFLVIMLMLGLLGEPALAAKKASRPVAFTTVEGHDCADLFSRGILASDTLDLNSLNSLRDEVSACVMVYEKRLPRQMLIDGFHAQFNLTLVIEQKKESEAIAAAQEEQAIQNAVLIENGKKIDALSNSLEQQRALYNNLVQNYSNLWQQANAAIDKALAQPQPSAWQRFADGFSQNMQTYYANQPQHIYVHEDVQTKPINCTSTVIGGTVKTNCY